jgi:Cdc6-like AAA superfamily ATPase
MEATSGQDNGCCCDGSSGGIRCRRSRVRAVEKCLQNLTDAPAHTQRHRGRRPCCRGSTVVWSTESGSATTTASSTENTSTNAASPSIAEISAAYAPVTLEKQFADLYPLLRKSLMVTAVSKSAHDGEQQHQQRRVNVSAFIQGPRGSGKTLLLNRVLQALEDEISQTRATAVDHNESAAAVPLFRMVYINGLVVPGHSVTTIVREILQQLSDAAQQETMARKRAKRDAVGSKVGSQQDGRCDDHEEEDRLGKLLHLKQTSFSNQLQLLTEIIQLASVDGIPILFVLDELETFLSHGGQLLMYHLLDRISTEGSFCSLIGLTCDSSILTRLDKRIKSRAEGTAKFVLTGRCPSFTDLRRILCSLVSPDDDDDTDAAKSLRDEVCQYFQKPAETSATAPPTQHPRLYDTLLRAYRTGKDVRWFCRLVFLALAIYRGDLLDEQASTETNCSATDCAFQSKYLEDALFDMGRAVNQDSAISTHADSESAGAADHLVQALCDLPGPSVALVLAARRILERDSSSHGALQSETSVSPQLTLHRMLHEYQSSYRGQTANYSGPILHHAFAELLEIGIFRPALDHRAASGILEYHHRDDALYNYNNMDGVERMPLQLTVDIHRVLKPAIEKNLLNCSTALREWGRKAY